MRKTREPGKTYHMSDVAGGTDLQVTQVEPSQVSSTRYVTRVIVLPGSLVFLVQR